jgi:hypothetical protein
LSTVGEIAEEQGGSNAPRRLDSDRHVGEHERDCLVLDDGDTERLAWVVKRAGISLKLKS